MSDDRMNLEVGVNVHTEGTDKLTDLDKILSRIKAAQDKLNSSLARGNSKGVEAAKEALGVDRDRLRVLKMQMGYESKARRDGQRDAERANRDAARDVQARLRDEQRAVRELGRIRRQEAAAALLAEREISRERARSVSRIGRGAGQVRSGVTRTVGVGAAAAAAATYASQRAVDSLTKSAVTIDEAMNQAMIHVYGSQDVEQSQKSANNLRKRLMPVASRLGVKTADLIGATVEAAQAGVEDNLLDVVVEQGTKYAKMNKLNVPEVLEQSGYALQGIKTFGKVTAETVKAYYDETSFLIATTSANRQQLLQATKTGMASGATVGMDRQQTLAMLGAITAVGGEGGQASRLLSTQGARAAGWRNKGRNVLSKHHRSADDRQFLDAVQLLGYRDSDAMADAFSHDFFGSMVQVQDRIKGISDPLKRKSITKQLFGQEFSSLIDSLIMGGQLQEFRDKLAGASGFLNSSWTKFATNLGFILDKVGVVLGNLMDTLSLALKPLYQDLGQWIDRLPSSFDGFSAAFNAGIDGLLRGLGSKDGSLTSILTQAFGDPSQFRVDARLIFDFAKGFGEGLREIAKTIRSVFTSIAGPGADAGKLGKWTAEFLAMSAALVAASPAILAMSGMATAIGGFATAMVGAWGLLRAAGLGGGAAVAGGAAAAGAGGGAAAAAGGSIFGRLLGFLGVGAAFNATAGLSKSDQTALTNRLGAWAQQREKKGDGHWADPPLRKAITKNTEAIKANTETAKDEIRKSAETKATEIKASEARKLSELVSIRNPAMSGSVGSGSSNSDQLRARGFNVIGEGGGGGGDLPNANLGNGVSAPRDRGDVAQRARQAFDYFVSRGYSPEAASGIIASLKQESNFTSGSRGDGGRAHGIAQWHPDRRANILRGTGINISTAGYADQLRALDWEMRNGDAGAQRARRILMTPGITARQAGAAFVQHFERPLRDERAHRGSIAEGYARQFRGSSPTAQVQAEADRTKTLADGITKPSPARSGADAGGPPQPGSGTGVLSIPSPPSRPRDITSGVPQGGGRRNGSAGGGVVVHIAAVHGGDAKSNGEEIGRQVRSAINSSYLDADAYGYG